MKKDGFMSKRFMVVPCLFIRRDAEMEIESTAVGLEIMFKMQQKYPYEAKLHICLFCPKKEAFQDSFASFALGCCLKKLVIWGLMI